MTELYLYNNNIEDIFMDEFCMCLSNKPNLKILGLEFNHLAEIGPKLISVLNQLPALEKAFFSHNSL